MCTADAHRHLCLLSYFTSHNHSRYCMGLWVSVESHSCYKHSNCRKTQMRPQKSVTCFPGCGVFMRLDYARVVEEGASGEQRTQTPARSCVKSSVQILTLAKDSELNLIFPQFCEGQPDSFFNFLREKRFALYRWLPLTMAISFSGSGISSFRVT